jgi:peptidoglycan/LPS O-acetylase OafA/YrhL
VMTVIGIERELGIHFGLLTLAMVSAPVSVLIAEVMYRFVGRPLRARIAGRSRLTESRTPL